jgi:hypothetical protein
MLINAGMKFMNKKEDPVWYSSKYRNISSSVPNSSFT